MSPTDSQSQWIPSEEFLIAISIIGASIVVWKKSRESVRLLIQIIFFTFGGIGAVELVQNQFDLRKTSIASTLSYVCKVLEASLGLVPFLFGIFFLLGWTVWMNPSIIVPPCDKKKCPELYSNRFSRLFFLWFHDFALLGYRRTLREEDLWEIRPQDSSELLSSKFQAALVGPGPVKVLTVLLQVFQSSLALTGVLKILEQILVFLGPHAVMLIVGLDSGSSPALGYLYVGFLAAVSIAKITVGNQYLYQTSVLAMRVRSMLCSGIYQKLHRTAYEVTNMGLIVNMVGMDSQALEFFFTYFHILWGVPLQILLSLYFQWKQLGATVFAGFFSLVLLLLLDLKIAAKSRNLIQDEMKCKDERLKATNELFVGIMGIKMTGSEPVVKEQIMGHREKELNVLQTFSFTLSVADCIWTIAPFLASLITFGTYLSFSDGKDLSAQNALSHLILTNIMQGPLKSIPSIVQGILQASVSLKRINEFMASEEIQSDRVEYGGDLDGNAVVISNGNFGWDKNGSGILESVNQSVGDGVLVGIVGETGSGKSSFLACLAGYLTKYSGSLKLSSETCCLVPQRPWIQNKTLEENIVLDKKLNPSKYEEVIEACALKKDLTVLPKGKIAEKGSSLSGGQKQRISLARAVYSDGDIYLLDDFLTSIDPEVGNYIFDNVIGSEGMLRNKTRFLITNNSKYLEKVDQILCIRNKTVQRITYQEYVQEQQSMSKSNSHFSPDVNSVENYPEGKLDIPAQCPSSQDPEEIKSEKTADLRRRVKSNRPEGMKPEQEVQTTQKIQAEETGTSKLDNSELLRLFRAYISNIGWWVVLAILALSICSQALSAGASIVVSRLSVDTEKKTNLFLYAGLGFGQGVIAFLASLALKWGTLLASRHLHDGLLQRILQAPLMFFDKTPSGKLLQRFSKEVDVLDKSMGIVLLTWLKSLLGVATMLVLILYAKPMYVFLVTPLVALCFLVQRFNTGIFSELRNLEAGGRAKILSHVSETLDGTQTVRAFRLQKSLTKEFYGKMDVHQSSYYAAVVAHRYMAVCLESIAGLIIILISIYSVSEEARATSGLVGIFMQNALEITATLNVLVIVSCSLETHLIAFGQNFENTEIPQESEGGTERLTKEVSTPANIIFENYSARYRPELNLVLKNVTAEIHSGEKIIIIGRTGAGKSSIFLALLRMIEAETGRILIGGQDIAKVRIKEVRQALTVVPQVPFLMTGTIRSNLDPTNVWSSSDIWNVLERTHLRHVVEGMEGQLEHPVCLSGSTLSLGHRQLLCITRAILNKTKNILLDEASSALDEDIDDHLQSIILKELSSTTVLVITHKLKAIMSYDRVMVIDGGTVVEFDKPAKLMKDKNSKCYLLANEFGVKI